MSRDKYFCRLIERNHEGRFSIFFFAPLRNRDLMRRRESRLAVQKTYKLFIGGKFVRGENGRVLPARGANDAVLANYCRASRKDFRDAVKAARQAIGVWS